MSDCLTALSEALAAVKSSVADGVSRAACRQGGSHRPADSVLTDADVVDLRHVTLGMVDLEQLKSPYATAPAPITMHEQSHVTDKQATKMANLLVGYELGFSPSEQDIEELLGCPLSNTALSPRRRITGPGHERKQIHAALERFSASLVSGCNQALLVTRDNSMTIPSSKTSEHWRRPRVDNVDPAIKEQWEKRNQQAEQQLFTQFTSVQDRPCGNWALNVRYLRYRQHKGK